jgi:HAE1 family hydrophobic/amphiphilic exporter-1
LLGLSFAIVVILLFLLSLRSTIVTAISIPTSVLIAFIGLYTFGFSLNLFTLSALTIAIGRVVDDSIVVIENINRHLSYGEPKRTAVLNAVKEVAGAITAATVTTVAVFFPITLVSGLIGELFRPFGLTFTIALLASLLVSLTIVPVLASWFLKAPKAVSAGAAEFETTKNYAELVRKKEEERERRSWLQRGYLPILRGTQKHPVLTVIASILILGYTFSLVPQLKTNFLSGGNSTSFSLNSTLPAGAGLTEKDAAAAKIESILLADPAIKVVQTSIGSSGDGRVAFGASAGGIQITVTAKDDTDMAVLQDKLQKQFDADASLGTVKLSAGGPPTGGSGTVDIKLTAPNDVVLREGITAVQSAMTGTANVTDLTNSLADVQRTLKVQVNRLKAAKLGLTEVAVSGIVANTMNPQSIGKINIENVSTSIFVVSSKTPKTVAEIKAIKIPTASGTVKLSKIADVLQVEVPTSITASKGDRTATVSLTPSGDNLGAITKDVTARLDKVTLPLGVTATIGGISADQASSFQQLGLALIAAVAIVYIVMVATFGSLMQPLMLLISIPFAATGALGLLLLTDTALGVPALIGMLLLVGVVVTNAIVLIDLINQYRKLGRDLRDAIMDGARQRLRPILMTALATIFALTPMALESPALAASSRSRWRSWLLVVWFRQPCLR